MLRLILAGTATLLVRAATHLGVHSDPACACCATFCVYRASACACCDSFCVPRDPACACCDSLWRALRPYLRVLRLILTCTATLLAHAATHFGGHRDPTCACCDSSWRAQRLCLRVLRLILRTPRLCLRVQRLILRVLRPCLRVLQLIMPCTATLLAHAATHFGVHRDSACA